MKCRHCRLFEIPGYIGKKVSFLEGGGFMKE